MVLSLEWVKSIFKASTLDFLRGCSFEMFSRCPRSFHRRSKSLDGVSFCRTRWQAFTFRNEAFEDVEIDSDQDFLGNTPSFLTKKDVTKELDSATSTTKKISLPSPLSETREEHNIGSRGNQPPSDEKRKVSIKCPPCSYGCRHNRRRSSAPKSKTYPDPTYIYTNQAFNIDHALKNVNDGSCRRVRSDSLICPIRLHPQKETFEQLPKTENVCVDDFEEEHDLIGTADSSGKINADASGSICSEVSGKLMKT